MEKIMILGAGVYQVPLIEKAEQNGFYTIVTSTPGDYPGFSYADEYFLVDTTNKEKILDIARKEQINAIITTGTDVAVPTIGYVCQEMDLPGISEECADLASDKIKMKQAFYDEGVNTAPFQTAGNVDEAKQACEQIGFPVIFKCIDSSGSRGIAKAEDLSEIDSVFEYAMSQTHHDRIIIEKFIEGHEIGVDGYVNGSEIRIIPHDKIQYYNGKTNVPIGHVFPYECDSKKLHNSIIEQSEKAVRALKMDHCFFNMDVLLYDNDAYVIEAGARTGATCIPELISVCYGVDYYQMVLDLAIGNKIHMETVPKSAGAGRLLFSEKSGILTKFSAPHEPGVDISLDVKIGDAVPKFSTGNQRIGQITVSADTKEEALKKLNEITQQVIIEVQ